MRLLRFLIGIWMVVSLTACVMGFSEPIPKSGTHRVSSSAVTVWRWPTRGTVYGVYSDSNKGINIRGTLGQPIVAAAAGKVVYCGHGLRDYGNLIIIKHNSMFLTAYTYASELYVINGQWVKAGQKIAAMGEKNTHRAILHFEIRRDGEPVNPLFCLPKND